MKKLKPYPTWICNPCGLKALKEANHRLSEGHLATFHFGPCGVCGQKTAVTEPRDYKYPPFKGHEKP